MDLGSVGSLALFLKGISTWLETPNISRVPSLLAVGAALRTEGGGVGHPVEADMLRVHGLPGSDGHAGQAELLAQPRAEEK